MRIETTIDDELCECPTDQDRLAEAIDRERDDLQTLRDKLAAEPNELDRTRLGRILNRLSDHLKLDGQPDEALELAREARQVWATFERPRATFLARLREWELTALCGDTDEAVAGLDAMAQEADEEPFELYRDFVLEARGRIHFRAGDIQQAKADLQECLEQRRELNRGRLVDRTEKMLALVDRHL